MQKGSKVSIEYTLTLQDGSEVDTNVGQEPLEYEHGAEQILPALEAALGVLAQGDSTKVTLAPDDAYGQVDPEAFQEVPLDSVPEDAREAGTQLVFDDGDGNRRLLRVHEIREEIVVVDFNHPLAGETLTFEVKVLGIEA